VVTAYLRSLAAAIAVMCAFWALALAFFRDDIQVFAAVIRLGQAAACLVAAGYFIVFWGGPVFGIPMVALAAYYAWRAWQHWRRRKNRKPSRVLGVVRNLGHRLEVVPAPGGAR
jgi:hypothetical protein